MDTLAREYDLRQLPITGASPLTLALLGNPVGDDSDHVSVVVLIGCRFVELKLDVNPVVVAVVKVVGKLAAEAMMLDAGAHALREAALSGGRGGEGGNGYAVGELHDGRRFSDVL